MSRTLQVRLSDEAYAELSVLAQQAGVSLSDWARDRLLEAPHVDGRARRWAELRARLRPLLRDWTETELLPLTTDLGATVRVAALRRVAQALGLDRDLTPQEAGVVVDVAAAVLVVRAEALEEGR